MTKEGRRPNMKYTKKLLGFFLTLAIVFGMVLSTPITAEANYSYRVKISLGNNQNASFSEEYINELKGKYTIDEEKTTDRTLVIKDLAYSNSLELDAKKLITITANEDDTTYYVKGLRVAGSEALQGSGTDVTYQVTGDETLVVAYGVGTTVPYTIKYQDVDGNTLLEDEIRYGAVGEVLKVPARHFDGYKPDAFFKTNSAGLKAGVLKQDEEGKDYVEDGTEFVFKYKKYDPQIIYEEQVEYEYQYSTTTTETNNGGTTTVVRRNGGTAGNQQGGTRNTNEGNAGGNEDNAGDNAAPEEPAGDETIAEEETPLDVIDIDDEEVAKVGERKDTLVRNMIIAIIIAIIAVVSILIALYVANSKRKAQIVKSENKDNKK